VGEEAYLHVIFPPVDENLIAQAEQRLRRAVPRSLRDVWSDCNGLSVFGGALDLFGCRANWKRSGDSVWQPYDIEDPNTLERPKRLLESFFVVGGIGGDGDLLCIDTGSDGVIRCAQDGKATDHEWPSLPAALAAEFARLEALFEKEGS
jgi:SMI1/KNR4 family protein SUKH-1